MAQITQVALRRGPTTEKENVLSDRLFWPQDKSGCLMSDGWLGGTGSASDQRSEGCEFEAY